MRGGMRTITLR